jgi:hypothetical protein
MQRIFGPRKTGKLSDSVNQRLNMYAVAASAAGVGIMALAQPAQARIVYTRTHQAVGRGLTIDLNHDGIADFKIQPFACCIDVEYFLLAFSLGSNRVFGAATHNLPPASDLRKGYRIGPNIGPNSVKFQKGFTFSSQTTNPAKVLFVCTNSSGTVNCAGPWLKSSRGAGVGYLGFRFLIKGEIHYGWARLNISGPDGVSAILTGYAYETIPGKPIIAGKTIEPNDSVEQPDNLEPDASLAIPIPKSPQPASLGMLALGAHGLTIWRRKESAVATQ